MTKEKLVSDEIGEAEANTKKKSKTMATSIITFARSIQVSEGLFYGVGKSSSNKNAGNEFRVPIEVHEKGVRGQSSDYKAEKPGDSNPQTVEHSMLPNGCDSVELDFNVRVLSHSVKPHACNDKNVSDLYKSFSETYRQAGGYAVLAKMYIRNIANARFAWRNRFQSDKMAVRIEFDNEEIVFDPLKLGLSVNDDFSELSGALVKGDNDTLMRFVNGFAAGLSSAETPFEFRVVWSADMIPGQEIFPSQEYLRDGNPNKEDLSRVYAKIPCYFAGEKILQASMHSQKINAAIRFIDVWHDQNSDAIPVNPFGGIQETGEVYRRPKTNSLYDIRSDVEKIFEEARAASSMANGGNAHFLMANLVRGGVFNQKESQA